MLSNDSVFYFGLLLAVIGGLTLVLSLGQNRPPNWQPQHGPLYYGVGLLVVGFLLQMLADIALLLE